MQLLNRKVLLLALVGWFGSTAWAATFGTVVPIGGHAADIGLDELRGRLYVANFTANRIEVIRTTDNVRLTPIPVSPQPGSLALSPDGRYLVVGHYATPEAPLPAVTILDLQGGPPIVCSDPFAGRAPSPSDPSPLAIAFGSNGVALIAHNVGFDLLNPSTGCVFQPLQLVPIESKGLPVPFATFPPEIIQASAGVSGDRNTIYVLAQASANSVVAVYHVADGLIPVEFTSTPDLGPAVVSVDRTGATFMAGWTLLNPDFVLLAQFPYPTGRLNLGSHAFDDSRNLIYANVPTAEETSGHPSTLAAAGQDGPVLTILDSDNLTVRERLRLQESLAGKSLLSSDRNVMYSVSDSGVTILPVGSLAQMNRVNAKEEDVLFSSNACQGGVISKEINVEDPGGGHTDFALSTSSLGIQISPSTGTTPALVRIDVDPTFYQNQTGTTAVRLDIRSSSAINFPMPVRLLINTREPDQRGTIVNVPGKLVDILADPVRDRIYILRQDKNQVLVFDGSTFTQIGAPLRTGNTPVQMAITSDRKYLLVGNDNSQIANVYDLDLLRSAGFVAFPPGHYPHSVAVSSNAILATMRVSGPVHTIDRIVSMPTPTAPGIAVTPTTLGIYVNSINPDAVLSASPSGGNIFMAMSDGTVALYEATADTFVASRKDFGGFSGAYTALTDQLFIVDNQAVNWSLVPIARLESETGSSSGVVFFEGGVLQTTSNLASAPGVIQRLDLSTFRSLRGIRMAESPLLSGSLRTPPIGQIGQTILPFTRTLAPLPNRVSIVSLTISGFTVLPWNFDIIPPVPVVNRIVNAADQAEGVAPGGLVSIFGSDFSAANTTAGALPLPTSLGDVCVSANGTAVPLMTVSPSRIDAQLPFAALGTVSLVANTVSGVSSPFSFTSLSGAPAVFRTGTAGSDTGIPTVYRASNGELVTLTNPIHPEDNITIFATGLGSTSPAVNSGFSAPSDPIALVSLTPLVSLGGVPMRVAFAGLVPGLVGVYQINAEASASVPEGFSVPLTIAQGGYSTTLNVRVVK
jgi:uncharacterized protein (TIGR03437 family)